MERTGFNVNSPPAGAISLAFVSQATIGDGLPVRVDTNRRFVAIQNMRGRGQEGVPENTALPRIEVDPDTYSVKIDGEIADHEPASEVPMVQRYFLF